MTLDQIKNFENHNISINVYSIEKKNKEIAILPIQVTDRKIDKHVNLLYMHDDNVGHFVWIKNLSRLVSSQLSKNRNKKYFCDQCLHYFYTSEKLEAHTVDCQEINDCAIKLPSDNDKWLAFKNHNRKERVPFIVYTDLECTLEKMEPDPETTRYTYQHHRVFSIGYYVRCSYDESLSMYRFRRDKDCVAWFAEELRRLAHDVKTILSTNIPMADFTRDEWEKFNSATHCHVCEEPFEPDDVRVRDHCHLTGRYRGPAHSNCNLNYKDLHCIPIVFHNLSGYDAHFIITEIATAYEGHVDLFLITKGKYISFTKNVQSTEDKDKKTCVKLRFIDSYKFFTASLDKLAFYLSKNKLQILQREFCKLSAENFDLLTRATRFTVH
ncbi:uncharacterized protein [Temnothorax longispinosus]|uniref:uncharacterized protein n=1 Tax=Temnothorax longispinosus TaxID=300112 RepID=UPI003A9A498F